MPDQPHSAEYFGAQRDFWWNPDFLNLMAMRWRLDTATSLADIGCGLCHWSRLLYPYLRAPARFTGVDREARWVTEAPNHFRNRFPELAPELCSVVQGDATALPLPDNSFDVVTCQTLLMHLDRPLDALREMRRILRPGGLLICAEPNNFWNYVPMTSLTRDEPTERLVERFEFWLRYLRGKSAAGLGDESIGELLPGFFIQLGLLEIKVHQSDKASAIYPPYDATGQRALLQQEEELKKSEAGPWNKETTRARVLGGGGSEELFERGFADMVRRFEDERRAIAAGTFHAAYGALNYLVSGRKAVGARVCDPQQRKNAVASE